MDKDDQNNIFGELIYAKLQKQGKFTPERMGKITTMLTDEEILDFDETISLLLNENEFQERIKEAIEIIEEDEQEKEQEEEQN